MVAEGDAKGVPSPFRICPFVIPEMVGDIDEVGDDEIRVLGEREISKLLCDDVGEIPTEFEVTGRLCAEIDATETENDADELTRGVLITV